MSEEIAFGTLDAPNKTLDDSCFQGAAGNVFNLKLSRPYDQRPPHKAVRRQDHQAHRRNSRDLSITVAASDCCAHVRSQAGKLEVLVSKSEGFIDREKEPSARHGDHAVVDQPLSGERQLDLPETPHRPKAADPSQLPQLVRDRLERIVVAENHVPNLRRKDHQHAGEFETKVAFGKQVDQREHETGHEPEYRYALQNIERRQEDPLGLLIVIGPGSIKNGENQGKPHRDPPARERGQRVLRQLPQ